MAVVPPSLWRALPALAALTAAGCTGWVGASEDPQHADAATADAGPPPPSDGGADAGQTADGGPAFPPGPSDGGPLDAGLPDYRGVDPLQDAGTVTRIDGGFAFTEGPQWVAAQSALLFTDIPNARIWKLASDGGLSVFRDPSGKANGLGLDVDGLLLACEHGNRRLSRTLADGGVVTVADSWDGGLLHSPNDVVSDRAGRVYFTDPDYGLEGRPAQLSFKGLYRVQPDGRLELLDTFSSQPNGVSLSPEEDVLYLADSQAGLVRAYPLYRDGGVGPRGAFAGSTGSADGMAMDLGGNLYVATNNAVGGGAGGSVQVFRPDGGQWGRLAVPEVPTNCAFGGEDLRTLFITAGTSLYFVRLPVPGVP